MIAQYELIENTSKKYFNGSVWQSRSCGVFTIIGKTKRTNAKGDNIYCLCEFEDGAIVEADYTNIKIGNVKSPNHPNVCGVGYMGVGPWKAKIDGYTTREYALWLHMISRCYSDKSMDRSPSYKRVTVCPRWLCFQNFCDDLHMVPGYELWRSKFGYELDKDILCERHNINPKIYSPTTCMFITKKENLSESTRRKNLTGNIYCGVDPNGNVYEFVNQTEFAIKHGLNSGLVSACINGKRQHHKHWKFYLKEN